jgi:hypothetical protein
VWHFDTNKTSLKHQFIECLHTGAAHLLEVEAKNLSFKAFNSSSVSSTVGYGYGCLRSFSLASGITGPVVPGMILPLKV